MDSFKRKVIKAGEIVNTGRSIPLSGSGGTPEGANTRGSASGARPAGKGPVQAQATVQTTESQMTKISEEAYAKGYAEGRKSLHKEAASAVEALAQATKALPSVKQMIYDKSEEQMVRLAFAIAEKILHQEVSERKDVIIDVLKGVLKNIQETEGMKIRLNTQDFRYMMEVKKDFLQSFDGIRNVVFEEDTSIKRGGAVVETLLGEIDARLESQLKEIKAVLLQKK